jgi:protein arginine N-methyltransferase 7
MVFTKQYGFRFSSCKYCELTAKQRVLDVDFALDTVGVWRGELRQRVQATHSGTVHAVLASWEVYDRPAEGERQLTMSTHPDATLDNFPRDMQWGQGLQLIEDLSAASEGAAPIPFVVTEGEWLTLVTRFSSDGVTVNFQLEREHPPTPTVVAEPVVMAVS